LSHGERIPRDERRVLTPDAIRGRIDAVAEQALDYRRRWDALMDQLRGVEQLFIAA
jgi:hypothetical protein